MRDPIPSALSPRRLWLLVAIAVATVLAATLLVVTPYTYMSGRFGNHTVFLRVNRFTGSTATSTGGDFETSAEIAAEYDSAVRHRAADSAARAIGDTMQSR